MDQRYFTDEHRMIQDTLRRFVDEEVRPHGDKWEEDGNIPREPLKKLGELGMLGLRHPEEYGGAGMNTISTILLAEELAQSTYGGFSAMVTVHTDMASPHLVRYGNKEQLDKYMPGILSGDLLTAIAVTEPNAGSDVAGIQTKAERKGNNAWVLNGAKTFITNGVNADVFFVAAKTDTSAGARGITMFIVEKGTPGFSVAKKLDKHGWRCSDTAELVFEDCEIPAENMLGEENKGFYSIMSNFQNERLVIGGLTMGEAQKAIDLTLEYVKTRKAFGGTLWDQQAIRQRLSMLSAKVEAGRQLTYYAAWLDAQGKDCVKEVSQVKAFCGELSQEVMYTCLQFHGGMGYMRESPIERMTRDTRILAIGGGATEVMLEEVAKRL